MKKHCPRIAAVSLLTRILDHRQTLDEARSQDQRFSALEGPDRGFARAIVSAALRQLGQMDMVLASKVTGRNFEQLDPDVRNVLRVGAAQIMALKTPPHAAVSETVEAARGVEGARKAGGLINAVLRKLREDDLDVYDEDPMSVWPADFQNMMVKALGEEGAAQMARAERYQPPLDLTVPKDRKLYAERMGGEPVGPTSLRLAEGIVENLMGYEAGAWWVQDVAATLPVHVLSPQKGEAVLDMCAAPGGKTMQIAASGAETTAVDRAAKRMRLVEQNLKRTRLTAKCIAADATKWDAPAPFDAVLLDAPCSALGTLRRHPEGPWIKSEDDLARFPQIQARLIEAAANLVKPGGRMVYCVCTPLPREGVEIVEAFLAEHEDWSRAPVTGDDVPDFANAITEKGDVLTLPEATDIPDGCDVFYIARLERR